MTKYIPSQADVEAFIAALPAATMRQIADRMGCGITKARDIKTFLNHHPEYGYTITCVTSGSPSHAGEKRHVLIETHNKDDLRYSGLHSVVHNAAMYAECAMNELRARKEANPQEAEIINPLIKMLDLTVDMTRDIKRRIA